MTTLETDLDERVIAQNALTSAAEHLKSLSSSHAPTFVAVEQRGEELKENLNTLLSSLIQSQPKVESAKEALVVNKDAQVRKLTSEKNAASSLAMLADRHRLRRRTLLQHSALLELLELPSLMDACVRSNDLYDEALSIAAFANTLERRHLNTMLNSSNDMNDANVVQNVVTEIRRREMDLKRQLLARLRGDVTMPQCLEVVTSLRRLNGVELERAGTSFKTTAETLERVHATMELRLQVDFFEARDAWLDSPAPSTSNVLGYSEILLESIERYRTRCFEIATQFLAIFRTASSSSTQTSKFSNLSLLSLWTTRRTQIFLTSLGKQLKFITTCATLRDVIDSTLFFSTSMGRIGADFLPLLPPIFEPHLVHIINTHWQSALTQFKKTLKICRDAGVASPLFTMTNTTNDNKDEDEGGEEIISNNQSTPLPPRQLLTLPALGRFLNMYLIGLNELRRCLLPGCFTCLRLRLQDIMNEARVILETNEKLVNTPGLKGEAQKLREVSKHMRMQFEECFLPYCKNALEIAFGCKLIESVSNEKKTEVENQSNDDDATKLNELITNEEEGKIDDQSNNNEESTVGTDKKVDGELHVVSENEDEVTNSSNLNENASDILENEEKLSSKDADPTDSSIDGVELTAKPIQVVSSGIFSDETMEASSAKIIATENTHKADIDLSKSEKAHDSSESEVAKVDSEVGK